MKQLTEKVSLAGFGTMGLGGPYATGNGVFFGWTDWVTSALAWTLMLVAIIAVVKYIGKE